MANEKTPVVWDDDAKKHRPLGSGEKMGGLSASSMISSDSGNLLQQGSDGLMLVTGSSLADPRADNLLEESDNGKLQVTSDRVVEWLDGHPQAAAAIAEAVKVVSGDSGNVIVQGTDKGAYLPKQALSSAVSEMTPAQLSTLADALRAQGGGLSVGSDGKLSVDFGSMDPAIMRGVVLSMVQQGGGIAVDQSGKLYVDFDSMPTDKFNAMLASLKMQVPLTAGLVLHVDNQSAAAGDDIVDGRGTAAKPFKTISACVSWAAGYYALGPYYITVHIHPGYYSETVTLPSFNATTGMFVLRASDYDNPPVILRQGNGGHCIHVAGGRWTLRRLKLVNNPAYTDELAEHFYYCIGASGDCYCSVEGCEFDMSYFGAATTHTNMYVIDATVGASVELVPMDSYATKFVYSKGDSDFLCVLNASANSAIRFRGSNSANAVFDVPCRGVATTFANATSGYMSEYDGTNTHLRFVVADGYTCEGVKYSVNNGGYIVAPRGGFPGTADSGYVESATYSWYKQNGE